MKSSVLLISASLFLGLLISGNSFAQENKEKEIKLKKQQLEKQKQQKEIDSLSKNSQADSEYELKQLIEEQKRAQAENQETYDLSSRRSTRGDRNSYRVISGSGSGSSSFSGSGNVISYGKPIFMNFGGSGDNTTFTISKKIKEAITFSSDFEYEVPENVSSLYFVFSSELEAGTLKISIAKPNGKAFQVFSVAPVANVDWNKQFKIKDGEIKDYMGTWKITISTKDAKGYYELKIMSY